MSCNHIEGTIVIAECRSKDTFTDTGFAKRQLAFTFKNVADLFPMDQIFAVKDWNTWEIGKCGCHQIVVILNPANRWIRIEARKDRVGICYIFVHNLSPYYV